MPCLNEYCISGSGFNYDGTYFSAGTYDAGYDYFTGDTYTIYYSTGQTQWCLATSLGDPNCLLFGKSPCSSPCPDLCDGIFGSGLCPTPTPTPTAVCSIDFDAIFDCDVIPTPTPTMTPTATATMTPTPSATNLCGGIGLDVSGITYTPTPTPTPSITPTMTPEITRPCNYGGLVTFNTLDDYIRCPNSKQFRDCSNGFVYSSTDVILSPSGGAPIVGMVYGATINEIDVCVEYIGVIESVSGVDVIELNIEYSLFTQGGCDSCLPPVSSTPTPTPTSTPTLTPSSTPEPCCEYRVTNLLFAPNTFQIKTCSDNQTQIININGGSTLSVKSRKIPEGTNISLVFVDCPCVTPTVTPTSSSSPTPTPSSTQP